MTDPQSRACISGQLHSLGAPAFSRVSQKNGHAVEAIACKSGSVFAMELTTVLFAGTERVEVNISFGTPDVTEAPGHGPHVLHIEGKRADSSFFVSKTVLCFWELLRRLIASSASRRDATIDIEMCAEAVLTLCLTHERRGSCYAASC